MGAFEYTALDAGGRERKGILEGDTPRHIRQLLREQQLLPVSVTEVAQKEARRQRSFSFARRVSPADLSLFTRQLATLTRAGLPLEEALLAVSQQTEKPRVQSIVLGVRARHGGPHPRRRLRGIPARLSRELSRARGGARARPAPRRRARAACPP